METYYKINDEVWMMQGNSPVKLYIIAIATYANTTVYGVGSSPVGEADLPKKNWYACIRKWCGMPYMELRSPGMLHKDITLWKSKLLFPSKEALIQSL